MQKKENPAGRGGPLPGDADGSCHKNNTHRPKDQGKTSAGGPSSEEVRDAVRDAVDAEREYQKPREEKKPRPSVINIDEHRAGRLIDAPDLPINWLLKDSLMERTVGLIVGGAGAGKSQYVLQLICAIASNAPSLIGFEPGTFGPVVYLPAEEDARILQRRLKTILSKFAEDDTQRKAIAENVFVVPGAGQDWRLIQNSGGNQQPSVFFHHLLEDLKAIGKIALLVIDPLARFHGAEENDNMDGTLFVSLLERLKEELKTTVLCVHHAGKNGALTDQKALEIALHQDAARGASGLTGAARWQLNLVPLPGGLARKMGLPDGAGRRFLAARVSKNNYACETDTFFIERVEDGVLVEATASPFQADLLTAIQEKISRALSDPKKAGPGITRKQMRDIYAPQWKQDNKAVSKAMVDAAIEQGLVEGKFFIIPGKNRMGKATEYLRCAWGNGDGID